VTRMYDRVFREQREATGERPLHGRRITAREIGPAYASCEEGIAGEQMWRSRLRVTRVGADAPGCVPGRTDDLQAYLADRHRLAVSQNTVGRWRDGLRKAEHIAAGAMRGLHEVRVIDVNQNRGTGGFDQCCHGTKVIEVAVRQEDRVNLTIAHDIEHQFGLIAWVDDDGATIRIAHDPTVRLESAHADSLDPHLMLALLLGRGLTRQHPPRLEHSLYSSNVAQESIEPVHLSDLEEKAHVHQTVFVRDRRGGEDVHP